MKPWVLVECSNDHDSETSFHETAADALTEALISLGVVDVYNIITKEQIRTRAQEIIEECGKECEFGVCWGDYDGDDCEISKDGVNAYHQVIIEEAMQNFSYLDGFSKYED